MKILDRLNNLDERVKELREDQLRKDRTEHISEQRESTCKSTQDIYKRSIIKGLPVSNKVQLMEWVEKLNACEQHQVDIIDFFRLQGGSTICDSTNRCLKAIAKDEVYKQFSLRGRAIKQESKSSFSDTKILKFLHGEWTIYS